MDAEARVSGPGNEPVITVQPPTPAPYNDEELNFNVAQTSESIPNIILEEAKHTSENKYSTSDTLPKQSSDSSNHNPSSEKILENNHTDLKSEPIQNTGILKTKKLSLTEKPPRKISSRSLSDQKLLNGIEAKDEHKCESKNPFDDEEDESERNINSQTNKEFTVQKVSEPNSENKVSDQLISSENNNNGTDDPIVSQPKKTSLQNLPVDVSSLLVILYIYQ